MQLIGRAFISVNGERVRSEPGATIDIGGVMRETVIGDIGVDGYAETPKQAVVDMSVSVGRGEGVARYRDLNDTSITFECDTGQVFSVRNAWLTEPPIITGQNGGQVKLKFEGPPAEEQI